jgi:hypothetical protein
MTEHLPECPCVHHPSEDLWCICWRLRECEERATAAEGSRYLGAAQVHWDAGHAWGVHDAEMKSRKHSLRKGLWIGWAIGTFLMLIPLIVLAVTQ